MILNDSLFSISCGGTEIESPFLQTIEYQEDGYERIRSFIGLKFGYDNDYLYKIKSCWYWGI